MPSDPLIGLLSDDLSGDLLGQGMNLDATCHRAQLPVADFLAGSRFLGQVHRPAMQIGSAGSKACPSVALDCTRRDRALPFCVFHATKQLVRCHSLGFMALASRPGGAQKALQIGCGVDRAGRCFAEKGVQSGKGVILGAVCHLWTLSLK